MRAFVRLREILLTNRELAQKLTEIERSIAAHDAALGDQAKQLQAIILIIRQLMKPKKERPRLKITGFTT